MLDHLGIAVSDMAGSLAFYEPALKALGIARLMTFGGTAEAPDHVGFGSNQKPDFWLARGGPGGGHVHVAFAAESRDRVDAFYRAALEAGGRDNGPPGLRAQYHPGYYGAFVLDPDGNNIEAVHRTV